MQEQVFEELEQVRIIAIRENKAQADIADSNAELAVKQAAALQCGEVARREAAVEIQKA
ncbi:MAG: hypothetical protein WC340_11815 [Kiritimatiellia bacterium]